MQHHESPFNQRRVYLSDSNNSDDNQKDWLHTTNKAKTGGRTLAMKQMQGQESPHDAQFPKKLTSDSLNFSNIMDDTPIPLSLQELPPSEEYSEYYNKEHHGQPEHRELLERNEYSQQHNQQHHQEHLQEHQYGEHYGQEYFQNHHPEHSHSHPLPHLRQHPHQHQHAHKAHRRRKERLAASDRRSLSLTPPRRIRSLQPHNEPIRGEDYYTTPPPRRSRSHRIHRPYPPLHYIPPRVGSSSAPASPSLAFEKKYSQPYHQDHESRPPSHHPARIPVSYICASARACYPSTSLGKMIRDKVQSMTEDTRLVPAFRAYRQGEQQARGMVPEHPPSDPNQQDDPQHRRSIRLLKSTEETLDTHSVLGRGSFSVVTAVTIKERNRSRDKDDHIHPDPHHSSSNLPRGRRPRYYACKSIKEELLVSNVARMRKRGRGNDETYNHSVEYCVLAASQLAYEAHILACLDHPNIIKMRGLDSEGILGFEKRDHRGFFLLMDVLSETLDQKIEKWRSETAIQPRIRQDFEKETFLLQRQKEKLGVCLQLASAFEYLHERRVVYRDLKPSNVGFIKDGRDTSSSQYVGKTQASRVQLFDFGLSRELTPGQPTLIGAIGTMRYMAPEVCLDASYDCNCDIYSYSIVCWELWTQRVPFEDVATPDLYREQVCQRGYRPVYHRPEEDFEQNYHHRPTVKAVPDEILLLLSQAWKPDPGSRIKWPKTINQLALLETLVGLQLEERKLSGTTPDPTAVASSNLYRHGNHHHHHHGQSNRHKSHPQHSHSRNHYEHTRNAHGHHHDESHARHSRKEIINIDSHDSDFLFSLREEDLTEDLGI